MGKMGSDANSLLQFAPPTSPDGKGCELDGDPRFRVRLWSPEDCQWMDLPSNAIAINRHSLLQSSSLITVPTAWFFCTQDDVDQSLMHVGRNTFPSSTIDIRGAW